MYYCKPVITPVGELTLIASDRGLAAILWQDEVRRHPGCRRVSATIIILFYAKPKRSYVSTLPALGAFLTYRWIWTAQHFRKSLAGATFYSVWRNPQLPPDRRADWASGSGTCRRCC